MRADELRELDVGQLILSDAGLEYLAGMTQLESLELPSQRDAPSARFADAGLVHLRGLTNLKRLTLATSHTAAALAHLSPLKAARGVPPRARAS